MKRPLTRPEREVLRKIRAGEEVDEQPSAPKSSFQHLVDEGRVRRDEGGRLLVSPDEPESEDEDEE